MSSAAAVAQREPPPLTSATPAIAWRAIAAPTVLAAVLAVIYLIWAPPSADLAAQELRVWLFDQQGFNPWNGEWFGGHHTTGYSLLFPPLGSLLGVRLVGAIATVASAALFAAITDRVWGDNSRVGSLWFGAAVSASLFNGRMTFALGIAVGLAAILAIQRDRRLLSYGLALATGLASPVAAIFLALAGCAWAIADRRRLWVGIGLAAAALAVPVVTALAFPEGGSEPFALNAFLPVMVISAVFVVVVSSDQRVLRTAAVLYALATCATFLLDTPVGGNVTRMCSLFAGPLLACALWEKRRLVLVVLAPILIFFQLETPIHDVSRAQNDPAVSSSYYTPLLGFLDRESVHGPIRVEVLPTEDHWESRWVAVHYPIARGWVRQLDRRDGGLFYADQLDPVAYRKWIDLLAIGFVAVSSAPLDYAAVKEAELIKQGVPWLLPVFKSKQWSVYRVLRPTPLADAPVTVTQLGISTVSMVTPRAASSILRVRFSPYWALVQGSGCVSRGPKGMTRVTLRQAGPARLAIRFSLKRVFDRGPRCSNATAASE